MPITERYSQGRRKYKMEPEIIYRLVIAQTVLLGFQIVIYFGVEIFEKDPHDVSLSFSKLLNTISNCAKVILW